MNSLRQIFKRVHRNMNDKSYKLGNSIIHEEELNEKERQRLVSYMTEFFLEFDRILKQEI